MKSKDTSNETGKVHCVERKYGSALRTHDLPNRGVNPFPSKNGDVNIYSYSCKKYNTFKVFDGKILKPKSYAVIVCCSVSMSLNFCLIP